MIGQKRKCRKYPLQYAMGATCAAMFFCHGAIAVAQSPEQSLPSLGVLHLPPVGAKAGQALQLRAHVARHWPSSLYVHYRRTGSADWQQGTFQRIDDQNGQRPGDTVAASVPAAFVQPPGIEYFVVAKASEHSGQQTNGQSSAAGNEPPVHIPVFASAEHPHRLQIFANKRVSKRQQYLAGFSGRIAQVRMAAEYVDYGDRQSGPWSLRDRYYRIDADVGYRLSRLPLASLRFGYTHLSGDTPRGRREPESDCREITRPAECQIPADIKGGGWFELGFVLLEGLELDIRGMVLATQEGFNVGGRSELRIGRHRDTHVALGAENIADVGSAAFIRLGWDTVPRFPMAATVEVTNFPSTDRAAAVRLVYDIRTLIAKGFRIGARIGYQARDQQIGGATLGFNSSLDF